MDFNLTLKVEPPSARLTANGELDIFTARQVSRQLTEAINAGCKQILVDVGGVTFVDASALGVFARAFATLRTDDGSLGFVETSPPFRRLCKMTGLDVVFDLN